MDNISLKDVLNVLLFLSLTFLGTAARVMIEIEKYGKHLKEVKFFNRYILATILAVVLKIQLQNTGILKDYYSEVIILFCIFVNDIVDFVFNNKAGILLYFLNALTKGVMDLKKYLGKPNNKDKDN